MSQMPCLEVTEMIDDMGGAEMYKCCQCGTCTALCPWGPLTGYSNRKLNMMAQLGIEGVEEIMWECSTCKLCVERCPKGVDGIELVQAIRRIYASEGLLPETLRIVAGSLKADGNPWSGERDKRTAWAEGLELPAYEGQEYGWFPCCTISYDPRNKAVGQAQAKLLKAMGLDFGAFGNEMSCCGEAIDKIGDDEVTEALRDANTELFTSTGVGKLLVSSPHCLATFQHDYDVDSMQVEHMVQLLAAKLADGTLTPTTDLGGVKVTYHDPCYMGRHSQVYDDPRQVLAALPGVEVVEMPRNRNNSYCCGGGGGKMWVEVAKGERPSDNRVLEAKSTGATILATACPYCISMFEDAVGTLELEGQIRVVAISELVAEACGL